MLRRFLIVGALFLGAGVLVVIWGILPLTPLCGNEVVQKAVSPDGTRRAVVFQRDCGATTGFSTQISIIGSSEDLPNEGGNVFIAAGHPRTTATDLHWRDATTLLITTAVLSEANLVERNLDGIAIEYVAPKTQTCGRRRRPFRRW
jgi:hypothetical protein